MRLKNSGGVQLTYCTNIHPSNGLSEVLDNLKHYALPLKARLAPEAPFGIGLRLSGLESCEILEGDNLVRLKAQEELLEHIRVCFDTCHVAVAFEDPAEVLNRFSGAGIRVGKVQVSSALKVDLQDAPKTLQPTLASLAESTYLHQVVQRNSDGRLTQYPDLPDALPRLADSGSREWRIHL